MADNSFKIDKSLTLRPQVTPPANPEVNDIYNDGTDLLKYNGTSWEVLGSGGSSSEVEDLVALSGVPANSEDLGSFTGITIPDNQTIKQSLQALETTLEVADNLIQNYNGRYGTTDWSHVTYTAAAKPTGSSTPSGSGNFTLTTTSTNPLGAGSTSFLLTKTSTNEQGHAFQTAFPIPLDYRAKVLSIDISNIVMSGSFVAGSNTTDSYLIWYCAFSTDNGTTYTLAEPSNYKLFSNSTTISENFTATIQTPHNATHMRLIAYVSTTNTAGWQVKTIVSVKPCEYVYGSPVADTIIRGTTSILAFTNDGVAGTNPTKGTIVKDQVTSKQIGDVVEFDYRIAVSTVGSAGTGAYVFQLPSGMSFDASVPLTTGWISKYTAVVSSADYYSPTLIANAISANGYAITNDTPGGSLGENIRILPVTSTGFIVIALFGTSTSYIVSSANFNLGSQKSGFSFNFKAKIAGFSSSVQMSDSYSAREITSAYHTPSNGNFADNAWTTITYATKFVDSTASYNTTTGVFTAPTSGNYLINASVAFGIGGYVAGNMFNIRVQLNGSTNYVLDREQYSSSTGPNVLNGTITLSLKAGDTLAVQAMKTNWGGSSGLDTSDGTQSRLTITRISGPSAIAANETIAASYWLSANQAWTADVTRINFDSREFDTHGAVTTGSSWGFTAPIAGIYEVSCSIFPTASNQHSIVIYKGNTAYKTVATRFAAEYAQGTVPVYLLAGEVLNIRMSTNNNTAIGGALTATSTCKISIKKVN